jgi:hypothetical protein
MFPSFQSVTDWTFERTDDHFRPVPVMPAEERKAWIELNHMAAMQPITSEQRRILQALNRKISYRAQHEKLAIA